MLEIYLTGTKPHSGTTFISGGIAATMQGLGYSTALYLPVQTNAKLKNGYVQAPDMMFAKFMDKNITTYCSYLYKSEKLTQDVFSTENLYMDKNIIFQDYMKIINKCECLIMNGLSDLSTLIEPNFNEEEMLRTLNTPIVFIASLRNSSISEIIKYLNFIKRKNLNVRGVIINECPIRSLDYDVNNLQNMIRNETGYSVLGIIPKINDLSIIRPEDWIEYIICRTDLEAIFNVKISKLSPV